MTLPAFRHLTPKTVGQLCTMLGRHRENCKIIAGGTDLLVSMKQGLYAPPVLVNLKEVREMAGCTLSADGGMLGAALKLAEIRDNAVVRLHYAALGEAVAQVASPNIQNMGTLGGNLFLDTRCWYFNQSEFRRTSMGYCLKKDGDVCRAAPSGKRCFAVFSADTVPALIALGAEVELASWDGREVARRRAALEELYRDDGIGYMTVPKSEVAVAVHLPRARGLRSGFLKYRKRGSIDYPLASVAVALRIDEGRMRDVRIVLGAMASAPLFARESMALLEGAEPSAELISRAAALADRGSCPVKNQDGTPAHRRQMAKVYCGRLLSRLAAPS